MIEQTISHYRITGKLGAGGMGVVYKALDMKLQRSVALKFLPAGVAISDDDKNSLLREARAASALDHPNIGVIHGLEESEDHQLFIVMQYYDGETLAQKISRGLIPTAESLDLVTQIAAGLSAAHAHNIVHRDLKPSNIIIAKGNVPKIVDFGLARVVANISATQSISASGTLPYMSPEQILGESIDHRSDIWALGVLVVQMLTGSHPFLRSSTAAMTFAILNQPPAALDAVPAPLRPILYRALSKKRETRYANVEEMLRDIETARSDITSSHALAAETTFSRAVTPRELKEYMQNAATPTWTAGPSKKAKWLAIGSLGLILATVIAVLAPPIRDHFECGQRSWISNCRRRPDGFDDQPALEPRSCSTITLGGSCQCGAQSQGERSSRGLSRSGGHDGGAGQCAAQGFECFFDRGVDRCTTPATSRLS
jgi:serine/threonine protein kinase